MLGGDLNEVQQEAHDPRELQTVEGDLNEVWREAHNPRELRAVHYAQQVLVRLKDSSVARGVKITRVPTSTCQYPSHTPQPGEDHRGAGRDVDV